MNVCLFLTASTIFSCKKDIERRRYRRSCFVILFLHTLFPNFPDVSNKFSLLFSLSLSVSRPVVRRRLWPCRLYYCLIYTRTFTKPTKKKSITCGWLAAVLDSDIFPLSFHSPSHVHLPMYFDRKHILTNMWHVRKKWWKKNIEKHACEGDIFLTTYCISFCWDSTCTWWDVGISFELRIFGGIDFVLSGTDGFCCACLLIHPNCAYLNFTFLSS